MNVLRYTTGEKIVQILALLMMLQIKIYYNQNDAWNSFCQRASLQNAGTKIDGENSGSHLLEESR